MTMLNDAANALRTQYQNAGTLGDEMIISVGVGVTPPPAGRKEQVIDVTLAEGYAPPAESASGYDFAGMHFRVRTWEQADGAPRALVSLSS